MTDTLQALHSHGFDMSTVVPPEPGTPARVHVQCSQCEALAINGHACHEYGCPNTTYACVECGDTVDHRGATCGDCVFQHLEG